MAIQMFKRQTEAPAGEFLSSEDTIALFDRYVIPNYGRYPISLVRGEGSYVWDAEGKRYLDLFPGWGCNILGYSPPRVVQAIQEQAASLIHVPNTWYMQQQGLFAEALCSRGFGKAFFCNSGSGGRRRRDQAGPDAYARGQVQNHHV